MPLIKKYKLKSPFPETTKAGREKDEWLKSIGCGGMTQLALPPPGCTMSDRRTDGKRRSKGQLVVYARTKPTGGTQIENDKKIMGRGKRSVHVVCGQTPASETGHLLNDTERDMRRTPEFVRGGGSPLPDGRCKPRTGPRAKKKQQKKAKFDFRAGQNEMRQHSDVKQQARKTDNETRDVGSQ